MGELVLELDVEVVCHGHAGCQQHDSEYPFDDLATGSSPDPVQQRPAAERVDQQHR